MEFLMVVKEMLERHCCFTLGIDISSSFFNFILLCHARIMYLFPYSCESY